MTILKYIKANKKVINQLYSSGIIKVELLNSFEEVLYYNDQLKTGKTKGESRRLMMKYFGISESTAFRSIKTMNKTVKRLT